MKKDTYYFSHDATAKDDPKCMLLIDQLGLEGYGIFWVLIETLRTQPDYKCPLSVVPSMARRYNSSKEKFEAVVNQYDLFVVEDNAFFFSDSLMRRMEGSDAIRKRFSDAGKRGAETRYGKKYTEESKNKGAMALLQQGDSNPMVLNKIKLNKTKQNSTAKGFARPSLQEVIDYCLERKNNVAAEKFIDHYTSNGWKVGRNPMKDWKAAVRTWEKSSFDTLKTSPHSLSATPNYNEKP